MRNAHKAAALACAAILCVAGAISSALAGSTVPGWPSYIAMGGIGGPDGPSTTSVTSLSCSTAQGTGNDDFQGAPVDVIFSYAGANGAGDAGIMVPPFKALAMTGDLTTLSNCANNKRATRVSLVEYTGEFSGGESAGLIDLTDSPNASSGYPNGNYIMARHLISLGADAMALNAGVAACAGALQGPGVATCAGAATGGPVTYNGSNYYGTLILNPDALGTIQQGGSGWLTDINNVLSNNTNNPVNPGTGMAPGGVNTAVSIALCFLANNRTYANSYNPNGQAVGTVAYDATYSGTPVSIMEQMLADGYPPYSLNNNPADAYWPYSADNLINPTGNPPTGTASQVAIWFNACVSNPTYPSSYHPPSFANTLNGWVQANNGIIRAVAAKGTVTFAWQEDMYAAGGNGDFWMQTQLTSAQAASAYSTPVTNWLTANAPDAASSGAGTLGAAYVPDYLVFDRYGEDDSNPGSDTGGATLYNAQSWDNYLTGIGQVSKNFDNIPIMMWQIPGSHITNTTEANPELHYAANPNPPYNLETDGYTFSTAPVYFFGDSNLTSSLSNIMTGTANTNYPPSAVGNFDMGGAGLCNSNQYNCPTSSPGHYYYSQWLTYYQGQPNNYDWSTTHGKLAMAATNNVFAILWGAGGEAGNPVANPDSSPDNDHDWLANKIIAYYQNPTLIGTTQYALALTISGSGSVASSPSGISCTSSCSTNFNSGTQVTLTATAASGSAFTGWSGACSGTNQCVVTMNAAENVTATFVTETSHNLSVSISGSGTVTSAPSGINCSSACSASFASGTQVTLSATPANGNSFSGWSGACSGTGSCVVTMNATESVAANFSNGGGGSSSSSPLFVNKEFGSDTGTCLQTAPCRTLDYALSQATAGGTIDIESGGTFSPLYLTQPITINGPADGSASIVWSSGIQPGCVNGSIGSCNGNASANYAVEIVASSTTGVIELNNLVIDNGAGTSGAVHVASAYSVSMTGTVLHGGTGSIPQIMLVDSSQGSMMELYFSNCDVGFSSSGGGILVAPTSATPVTVLFQGGEVHNGLFGLKFDASELSTGTKMSAGIDRSRFFSFTNSAVTAKAASAGSVDTVLSRSTIVNTGSSAFNVNGANALGVLFKSTITGNQVGVAVASGGTVYSFGNNEIFGNSTNVTGNLTREAVQ